MQFTKLFNSILDSTIWQEPPPTKLVWITMLAMVDRCGEVHTSIPGLAKRAGVSLPECESALECLLSPDAYSRTKDHDGRRIVEIDGGFALLNHGKYRALLSSEERREYNRRKQAEYRAKKKDDADPVNDVSMTVNHNKQNAHITEAEAEADAEAKAVNKTYKFKKPTPDEVRSYAREIAATIDPESFIDFYESKGWMIGKNPMKDWKAAVRTWKRNEQKTTEKKSRGFSSADVGL